MATRKAESLAAVGSVAVSSACSRKHPAPQEWNGLEILYYRYMYVFMRSRFLWASVGQSLNQSRGREQTPQSLCRTRSHQWPIHPLQHPQVPGHQQLCMASTQASKPTPSLIACISQSNIPISPFLSHQLHMHLQRALPGHPKTQFLLFLPFQLVHGR